MLEPETIDERRLLTLRISATTVRFGCFIQSGRRSIRELGKVHERRQAHPHRERQAYKSGGRPGN